jgi:hypothetical protein
LLVESEEVLKETAEKWVHKIAGSMCLVQGCLNRGKVENRGAYVEVLVK